VTSPRPKLGSHFKVTANSKISRMPIRKVGSDTPISEIAISAWDARLPRRNAAKTPIGTPTASAMKAAHSDNSSVAGSRSAMREETLRPWRRLSPNSPARPGPRSGRTGQETAGPVRVGAQLVALLGRGVLTKDVGHRVADVLEQHEGDETHVSMTIKAWTSRRNVKVSMNSVQERCAGTHGVRARAPSGSFAIHVPGATRGNPQMGAPGKKKTAPKGGLIVRNPVGSRSID